MIRVTCNNCGRKIDIAPNKIQFYCPYCGRKLSHDTIQTVMMNREREKTTREREQTWYKEIEHKHEEKQTKLAILVFVGALIFLMAAMIFAIIMNLPTEEDHIKNGELKVTASSDDFKGQNYNHVYNTFINLGFENVELEANPDIVFGLFAKEGEVESISINGDMTFSEGDWYSKDAIIIIRYHTRK